MSTLAEGLTLVAGVVVVLLCLVLLDTPAPW
jgi:hypothetical protein